MFCYPNIKDQPKPIQLQIQLMKEEYDYVGLAVYKENLAYINIKVKIDTIEQLKELMRKIRKLTGVIDVYRMNN